MDTIRTVLKFLSTLLEVYGRLSSRSAGKTRPKSRALPPKKQEGAITPARVKPQRSLFSKVLRGLFTAVEVFAIYQIILRLVRRYAKFPAPAFIGRMLDSDHRRRMQPPRLVVERSGVLPGMRVLEIGCGSGAFTTHVARTAGAEGKVYALDVQPGMLRQIQAKLQRPENLDLRNLQVVAGIAHRLPFPTGSLDLVYMVTVMQEIPDKLRLLAEVRRVLKPGGTLAVTELLADPDYPWVTTTINMGKAGGFLLDDVNGNLWNYTVRFRTPGR